MGFVPQPAGVPGGNGANGETRRTQGTRRETAWTESFTEGNEGNEEERTTNELEIHTGGADQSFAFHSLSVPSVNSCNVCIFALSAFPCGHSVRRSAPLTLDRVRGLRLTSLA